MEIEIVKAKEEDSRLLSIIGWETVADAHRRSSPAEDFNLFLEQNYTEEAFRKELSTEGNLYHIMYYNGQPAGYSKIILNTPNTYILAENVTKLERIYLLKEFYDKGLGYELLKFNVEMSRQNNQKGIWLVVWIENERAIRFYNKTGFKIVGSYQFKVSERHSNPNHVMLLDFERE